MNDLDKIKQKLIRIFKQYLNLDFNNMDSKFLDINLFDSRFNLYSRDLLYIFLKIEQEFQIQVCEEYIINKQFSTFNNIVNIIHDTTNEK